MNWTRRNATLAGLALILLTNAVALGGVAYNRMGETQGSLRLSERELRPPYVCADPSENSGLALRLNWRSLPAIRPHARPREIYDNDGNPGWLDVPKMVSLGFRAPTPSDALAYDRSSAYRRQLPRDAFVVLEMDGPARQEALRRAEADAAGVPDGDEHKVDREQRRLAVDREHRLDSRLFAVDAGLDRDALRSRYPDRAMYAIVRGRIRPTALQDGTAPGGAVAALGVGEVNVPYALRGVFDITYPQSRYSDSGESKNRFDATLVFGQRSEPWLAAAARR